MERWNGKVAIVTGASSGIGAAVTEQLVEAGLKVVGIARRKERVEELAKKLEGKKGKLYALKTDITKEEEILKAFQWVKENVGPIHILINNAGIGRTTTLIDGNTKFWKDVLDTNVMGLCIATREVIRDMKANDVAGHIVHLNSILGHVIFPVPKLNVYPASKFAVTALTETLRQELNSVGSKIKVSSISPGVVDTEIFETNTRESGLTTIDKQKTEWLAKLPKLKAEDIADAVMYILGTPPHVQVHELMLISV